LVGYKEEPAPLSTPQVRYRENTKPTSAVVNKYNQVIHLKVTHLVIMFIPM
jgi:hypothetical protein